MSTSDSALAALTAFRNNSEASSRARLIPKLAHSLMLARPDLGGPAGAAARLGYDDVETVLKGAVASTNLSEFQTFIAASTAWARSRRNSAFDTAARLMTPVPRRTRTALFSALEGGTETEGAATILRRLNFDFGSMTERKVAAIVAGSEEALTAEDFELAVLDAELSAAVVAATDGAFIPLLESGVSPITATTNFRSDMRNLLAAVQRGQDSRLMFILGTGARDELSLAPEVQRRGGKLPVSNGDGSVLDIPCVTSDGLDAGEILLVDCSQVTFWADPIRLTTTRQASLQMSDAPTMNSTSPPGITAVDSVSLWQTHSAAVRAMRRFAIKKMTTTAVGKLSGVGTGSPATYWS